MHRRSPALLERAHWGDAQGNPLQFDNGKSPRHCLKDWDLVVTVSTDSDGWQYASVFKYADCLAFMFRVCADLAYSSRVACIAIQAVLQTPCRHFDYAREGGRASQRATDFVRRRLWHKRAAPSNTSMAKQHGGGPGSSSAQEATKAVTDALISPTTVMFGARCASKRCCAFATCKQNWLLEKFCESKFASGMTACLAGFGSRQRWSAERALCAFLWACLPAASSATRFGMWSPGILEHGESMLPLTTHILQNS